MKKILFILFLTLFFQLSFSQKVIIKNREANELISRAFDLAIWTVDTNTHNGILAAGADYGGEWTRDIAINSWNGVSLLRSGVAEKSLWSVTTNKDTIGHQYWDKIIWVIGAWNHYKVTGNSEFLEQAYICSQNTFARLESTVYDSAYGLFKGPSHLCDGIAGYPEPIFDPNKKSASVMK